MRNVLWIGLIAVIGLAMVGFMLADSSADSYQPSWSPPTLELVDTSDLL